jgi:hypothetical protein
VTTISMTMSHCSSLASMALMIGAMRSTGCALGGCPGAGSPRVESGRVGEPAPVHPHLFRHARARQIVRHTKSLALAQKQAGWARLHTEYLTLSDEEANRLIQEVPE